MVVAPREACIRVTMERLRLDEKAAAELHATDADGDRYHLILNTDWLGYEGAAGIVVAAVRAREWSRRGSR